MSDAYRDLASRHNLGDSTHYRRLLEYLMTPQQAELAVLLPADNKELSQKLKRSEASIAKDIDVLFRKGVVFPKNFQTNAGARFAKGVPQLHDATQSSAGTKKKLFDLWEEFCNAEYYPILAHHHQSLEQPPGRIIPAYRSIMDLPGILPAEDMREILKVANPIVVVPCPCRARSEAVGKACAHTVVDNCMQFNRGAEYSLARGSGKELTFKEALAMTDETEEHGLVHTFWNRADIHRNNVCHCCDDCCFGWVAHKQTGVPIAYHWAKSRFEARVDQDSCDGCQDCVERCGFEAISLQKVSGSKKMKAVVDPEKCFGCGVCVLKCDTKALKMITVRPPQHIPGALEPTTFGERPYTGV